MAVNCYKDLIVWQKSFDFTKSIYKLTAQLPSSERFGITDQIRRSAVSIPSNIAEGHARNNTKEFRQFVGIAKGSAAEAETQLLLIRDIYEIEISDALNTLMEIQKMLSALSNKLSPKS